MWLVRERKNSEGGGLREGHIYLTRCSLKKKKLCCLPHIIYPFTHHTHRTCFSREKFGSFVRWMSL